MIFNGFNVRLDCCANWVDNSLQTRIHRLMDHSCRLLNDRERSNPLCVLNRLLVKLCVSWVGYHSIMGACVSCLSCSLHVRHCTHV